jgi:uncharacterized damage-inducible protein DinB
LPFPFFAGPMTIRDILWSAIIAHGIHHRVNSR